MNTKLFLQICLHLNGTRRRVALVSPADLDEEEQPMTYPDYSGNEQHYISVTTPLYLERRYCIGSRERSRDQRSPYFSLIDCGRFHRIFMMMIVSRRRPVSDRHAGLCASVRECEYVRGCVRVFVRARTE